VAVVLLAITLVVPVMFRIPLLLVGNVTWLGFVGLVTWQSLRAEPFSAPSDLTLTVFSALLGAAAVSFVLLVLFQRRSRSKPLI